MGDGGVDGWRGGCGFALETLEGFERAVAGAASGVEAVLEFGEGRGVVGGRLAERVIALIEDGAGVLEWPHLRFGFVEAAEGPLAADKIVDEAAGFGGGGVVALVVLVDELLDIGEFFGGKEEGFGVEAGF